MASSSAAATLGKVALGYQARRPELTAWRRLAAPDAWFGWRDEMHFVAGIDHERWSRSVVEDDYGKLQQKVAEHVKAGDREAAKQEIAIYEGKVEQPQFHGAKPGGQPEPRRRQEGWKPRSTTPSPAQDQAAKQNSLSKTNQAAGWDKRGGAKKAAPPKPRYWERGRLARSSGAEERAGRPRSQARSKVKTRPYAGIRLPMRRQQTRDQIRLRAGARAPRKAGHQKARKIPS